MALTFEEIKERLKRLDEVDLLEILDISSEEILDRFEDVLMDRITPDLMDDLEEFGEEERDVEEASDD